MHTTLNAQNNFLQIIMDCRIQMAMQIRILLTYREHYYAFLAVIPTPIRRNVHMNGVAALVNRALFLWT